jgi:hypothetical protein
VAALRRADPPSKESYRLCIRARTNKRAVGPNKEEIDGKCWATPR